ncbi:solute carrier family 41 member 2-like isoform X2 [Panonychus citri]|uniref:solute carrier family 41 member 2-like isoform X2 n=1 Tax=Panonychus citri TaxID=50023 RepID=UPI0023078860|nr:solute carrier family 41 member 2-like isoform X2 [Panonychus citri]
MSSPSVPGAGSVKSPLLHFNNVGYNNNLNAENSQPCGVASRLKSALLSLVGSNSNVLQVCIAITLSGFGNVGAGLILDVVQHWSVFKTINELIILVPSLLGLKGNLEMTMAARLSTQANLGNMKDFKSTLYLAKGNMALIQCQATVVAFLATIFAIATNSISKGSIDMQNILILLASSLLTANVACFLLGACMVTIIVLSNRFEIDPDNVATPLAASIGDVTTLALLASFAQIIQNHAPPGTTSIPSCIIILILFALLPFWIYTAWKNEHTINVITSGWLPIILAMLISSMGGFILNDATSRFERLAMFQPVINGVGGNLVAVQASRLSTYLHRQGKPGHLPLSFGCLISPCRAFIGSNINVSTARVLLLMSIPAHILYLVVFRLIKGVGGFEMTTFFMTFYLIFAVLQVSMLLYFAHNLVILLWRNGTDPDNFSIPILTALGDFLGTAFLLVVFILLSTVSDINAM